MKDLVKELESYVAQLLSEYPVSQELTQYIAIVMSEFVETGEVEVDQYNLDCTEEAIKSLVVPELDWEE